jgi:small subunit ribosomal protein S16
MVKIRLMRIGTKKRPFYRVVAVDERLKRTGAYLELLGTYNPLTHPHEINLKQDRIDQWIKQGAQMSDGFLRIIGKAPQRPPRKPKKEKAEAPKTEAVAQEETKPNEPTVTEESQSTPEDQPVETVEQTTEAATEPTPTIEETTSEVTEPETSEPIPAEEEKSDK